MAKPNKQGARWLWALQTLTVDHTVTARKAAASPTHAQKAPSITKVLESNLSFWDYECRKAAAEVGFVSQMRNGFSRWLCLGERGAGARRVTRHRPPEPSLKWSHFAWRALKINPASTPEADWKSHRHRERTLKEHKAGSGCPKRHTEQWPGSDLWDDAVIKNNAQCDQIRLYF